VVDYHSVDYSHCCGLYPEALTKGFNFVPKGGIMGTPHTIDICKNCGEPVIQYNNTGAWKHYPEPHPTNGNATDCFSPYIKAKDKTVGLASNLKTAVRKTA
jgi:hypothetical protein